VDRMFQISCSGRVCNIYQTSVNIHIVIFIRLWS